jgi:hypothetical protein
MRIVLGVLVGLVSLAVPGSAAILIDNFSTDQTALTIISGTANSGVVTGANSIGGARNLSLTVTQENAPNSASAGVGAGTLDFSNQVGVASVLTIIWDGGLDNVLTPNGFAPVDLTQANTNQFVRVATNGDLSLASTLTLWSGAGNFANWNFSLPSGAGFVDLPLTAPTSTTGSFTATGVTAARMVITGVANADRSIDFIEAQGDAAIPEPSTFALMGGALILVGMVRRRRA